MNEDLSRLLESIYEFGSKHDATNRNHSEQMLNITPETGLFLQIITRAVRANNMLEVGTSDGYSTLWIADALSDHGGRVTTVEVSESKFSMARENFEKSGGLSKYIDSRLGDVREFLKEQSRESFDLIFLDAERSQYVTYWKDLDRVLKTGSLLIVDNALSPKPEELRDFFNLVDSSGRYLSLALNLGKGEMIALKEG